MQRHNNTKTKFLKDLKLNNNNKKGNKPKEKPWQQFKMSSLDLSSSYKRLDDRFKSKANRVSDCGSWLEFKRYEDMSLLLHKANFCKVRLCPMCAWRRSLKIFGQVSKVMDYVQEREDCRFVFLTLTCRNVYGEDLKNQIDTLFHSFKKLSERKQFKKSIKGWFRGLEVTHDVEEKLSLERFLSNKQYYESMGFTVGSPNPNYDTYHPHFHCILMVNKSYFTDKDYYISQEKWTDFWKSCMNVDYNPIVDVRSIKDSTKEKTKKSIAEVAKYSVKSNDFLVRNSLGLVDEEKTDSSVYILDQALANRRLSAFGGKLKEIHKELNLDDTENGDLINVDNDEEIREDLAYTIERYNWHFGWKNYVLTYSGAGDEKK